MAEPGNPKVEVVFTSGGVEVVRLYGASWSDQEPALALYRNLAPFIRQVHVRFREELVRPSSGTSSPANRQEKLSNIKKKTQPQSIPHIRQHQDGPSDLRNGPASYEADRPGNREVSGCGRGVK